MLDCCDIRTPLTFSISESSQFRNEFYDNPKTTNSSNRRNCSAIPLCLRHTYCLFTIIVYCIGLKICLEKCLGSKTNVWNITTTEYLLRRRLKHTLSSSFLLFGAPQQVLCHIPHSYFMHGSSTVQGFLIIICRGREMNICMSVVFMNMEWKF